MPGPPGRLTGGRLSHKNTILNKIHFEGTSFVVRGDDGRIITSKDSDIKEGDILTFMIERLAEEKKSANERKRTLRQKKAVSLLEQATY